MIGLNNNTSLITDEAFSYIATHIRTHTDLRLKNERKHTFVLNVLSAVCGGRDYVRGPVLVNDVVVQAMALFNQRNHRVKIKSSDMLHEDVGGGLQRVAVKSFGKEYVIQEGLSPQLKLVGWAELEIRLLEKYGWKLVVVSVRLHQVKTLKTYIFTLVLLWDCREAKFYRLSQREQGHRRIQRGQTGWLTLFKTINTA